LLAALCPAGDSKLDPDLVLSFLELTVPAAPRQIAVPLVARLCGFGPDDSDALVTAVDERHKELVRRHQERLREEKKRGQLSAKILKLLALADWPAGQAEPASGYASPLREPNDDSNRGRPGRWKSERLGREVGYDSEAELRVIQMLELADDLVASYCEQPVRISYTLYGRRHDYFPDLLVDLTDGRRLLVEVKCRIDEFALQENVAKFKAAKEYCHSLGWGFVASTDRIQTSNDLVNRPVANRIEQALRNHLSTGPTDWWHLHPLMAECDIRHADVATLVLRNGWYWHKDPYRLSTSPLDGDLRWAPVPRRDARR
jgi:hypothetical protein